jgi:hypothetical protein
MKPMKVKTRKMWTDKDFQILITLYMKFLKAQREGEHLVKKHGIDAAAKKMGRSDSSVSAALMNLSAVLVKKGSDYVDGWKPLGNYNKTLPAHLDKYLLKNTEVSIDPAEYRGSDYGLD